MADEFLDIVIKTGKDMADKITDAHTKKDFYNYLDEIVQGPSQEQLDQILEGSERKRLSSTLGLVDLVTLASNKTQDAITEFIIKRPYRYPGEAGYDEDYLSLISGYLVGKMVGIGPRIIGLYARKIDDVLPHTKSFRTTLKILRQTGLLCIFWALLSAIYKRRFKTFMKRFTPMGNIVRQNNQYWPEILIEKINGFPLLEGLSRYDKQSGIELLRNFGRKIGMANKMFMADSTESIEEILPELSQHIKDIWTMETWHKFWYNFALAGFFSGIINNFNTISSAIFVICGIISILYRKREQQRWMRLKKIYYEYKKDIYFKFGELFPREMIIQTSGQEKAIKTSDFGRASITTDISKVIHEDWVQPILLLEISYKRIYAQAYWFGIQEGFFGLNMEKEIAVLKSTGGFQIPSWIWVFKRVRNLIHYTTPNPLNLIHNANRFKKKIKAIIQ